MDVVKLLGVKIFPRQGPDIDIEDYNCYYCGVAVHGNAYVMIDFQVNIAS